MAATAAPARHPNIVVILLDNVGREWFGCYGSEENCTPNIDRLAQEGTRFTNVYAGASVCAPSALAASQPACPAPTTITS